MEEKETKSYGRSQAMLDKYQFLLEHSLEKERPNFLYLLFFYHLLTHAQRILRYLSLSKRVLRRFKKKRMCELRLMVAYLMFFS